MLVVCKKYYLDVIVNELESTSTYREVNDECENVVSRHLHYTQPVTYANVTLRVAPHECNMNVIQPDTLTEVYCGVS